MLVPCAITWFPSTKLVGTTVSFCDPYPSTWKLERKLTENTHGIIGNDNAREARVVFIGTRVDKPTGEKAIIKIRMQIPHNDTVNLPASKRARQARHAMLPFARDEIAALELLTKQGCTFAPTLLAWKQEKQGADMWVPGGPIVFILMEKVPGICLADVVDIFLSIKRDERDQLREAFKKAWLECASCGLVNFDAGLNNLVWDRERQKCYIIDWEASWEADPEEPFFDHEYLRWGLVEGGASDPESWEY
ncbi:hypothetical protein VTN77DRAFT_2514 [Rasamsonia byssochlamydoides]|uniref:uncharacterized protein n=1 Tax=Rasamsonia byssochlamydoides TaxID=89139 RepID=UPI003741F62E